MTREEIIEQLENMILLIRQNGKDWLDERDIPILEEAIKAMKMEPCEDVISRRAAVSVHPEQKVIRCKDCKWFGKIGCAISIVDDSDKPTEDDFCSFSEAKMEESEDKCKNCEYYRNPDYARCHECKAESEEK